MATRKSAPKGARKAAATPGSENRMAIDLDQLELLMQTLDRHGIHELEIERGGERIVLRRAPVQPAAIAMQALAPIPMATPSMPPPSPAPAPSTAAAPSEDDASAVFVTSPFVGTFYRSPNPSAPPFVEAGGSVKKGQVLCIVEAMKLMNEIECDLDGTLVSCLVENGKPVEYGERLFKIKKR